jgi:hypothetical protein
MAEASTKECDFCKEEIRADAIRCKHCGSAVGSPGPTHGGTCPYCKEAIKPDAVKCKHCGSTVVDATQTASEFGCGCGGTGPGAQARFGVPATVARGQGVFPPVMQRLGFRRVPGPFGPIVISGGPLDPGDPWYCEGHYTCIRFWGTDYCFWVCETY